MKAKYLIRTLKDGKIVEKILEGRIFDIVFRTKNGDIKIDIKDERVRVHGERRITVYPEAANAVVLEASDLFFKTED